MSDVPAIVDWLPDVVRFAEELRADLDAGRIADGDEWARRCRSFYTDDVMDRITGLVPRWRAMASYAEGVTLRHTTAALASLLGLPEYRAATDTQRRMMEWVVLLHDVAKEPTAERRDHRHAFRSAAAAGKVLPAAGFEVGEAWPAEFPAWYEAADTANHLDPGLNAYVQDNSALSRIIGGADRLFGRDAAVVIKAIALHLSLTVTAEWPAYAPLTPAEERQYLDADLRPVLLAMMLADHGGWNLFQPDLLAAYYRETREVFARFS